MRYRVWPYKQGSSSAAALAASLGGRVLKRVGSQFVAKPGDVIVNWGDINPPSFVTENKSNIQSASNKLHFFRTMRDKGLGNIIPAFWEDKASIPADAYPIVCRTVLAGHSGAGIVIANSVSELVDAPLYVRYTKKKDEYRVHCSSDQIIAVQRKARRLDTPDGDVNWQVRNHSNGFVFVRGGLAPHDSVTAAATAALGAVGLDFGAVDVLWNADKQRAYVLEINTAPGLEGQTVLDYAGYFLRGDGRGNSGRPTLLDQTPAGVGGAVASPDQGPAPQAAPEPEPEPIPVPPPVLNPVNEKLRVILTAYLYANNDADDVYITGYDEAIAAIRAEFHI